MHLNTNHNSINFRYQKGSILVLSLLLMTLLTLLSTTAMQSSYLSFKSQLSRIEFQRNINQLNQTQLQAAKQIKDFIDFRNAGLKDGEPFSDGFLLLDELLTFGEVDNVENTHILSYSSAQMQIEVFISQSWLSRVSPDEGLQQHNTYELMDRGNFTSHRYLYLQLHCLGKPTRAQYQSDIHIIGDFRFEVSS